MMMIPPFVFGLGVAALWIRADAVVAAAAVDNVRQCLFSGMTQVRADGQKRRARVVCRLFVVVCGWWLLYHTFALPRRNWASQRFSCDGGWMDGWMDGHRKRPLGTTAAHITAHTKGRNHIHPSPAHTAEYIITTITVES